ncbi:MAG: hypothetical protein U5R06_24645 [candidate division KSB1 bacterium]|nr:hypothetical protein [candidate division KSB1 bacterium]
MDKKFFSRLAHTLWMTIFTAMFLTASGNAQAGDAGSIQPWRDNSCVFWEYDGKPMMLIGASDDDNLLQWNGDALIEHLDLIKSMGGNYVRNTMSDRSEGNIFAVKQLDNGRYDLEQWNEAYWDQLTFFLDETAKRGIIVHLTLSDWFDLSGDDVYGRFAVHPLNPENNINWEAGAIENAWDYYGGSLEDENQKALDYQHRYVDRLMSISARYNHIIYNIGNESGLDMEWDNYWATDIKKAAKARGKTIHVTTMRFAPDISVRRVMSRRDVFSFVDVSQNNQDALGPVGKKHWENLLFWRKMIAMSDEGPMPINNVKVYGEGVGLNTAAGSEKEAVERFWRNIFGGAASTRFHRPASATAAPGAGASDFPSARSKPCAPLICSWIHLIFTAPNPMKRSQPWATRWIPIVWQISAKHMQCIFPPAGPRFTWTHGCM